MKNKQQYSYMPWLTALLLFNTACGTTLPLTQINSARTLPFSVNGKTVADAEKLSVLQSATGDLNSDGVDDLATIIAISHNGSGTFHYLNVFIADHNRDLYLAGEEFLGDRISPLTLTIRAENLGQIRASYLSHAKNQPMTEKPALHVNRNWKVDNDTLVRLGQE